MIVIYAIPGFLAAGTAAAFGWGFSNWQYWACLLPVVFVSAAFYVARGY